MSHATILTEQIRDTESALARLRASATALGKLGTVAGNVSRLRELRAMELELETVLRQLRAELRHHQVAA